MENSSSSSPPALPDVYIFDCDNEAEPYWQIMVELFLLIFLNATCLMLLHLIIYSDSLKNKMLNFFL